MSLPTMKPKYAFIRSARRLAGMQDYPFARYLL